MSQTRLERIRELKLEKELETKLLQVLSCCNCESLSIWYIIIRVVLNIPAAFWTLDEMRATIHCRE